MRPERCFAVKRTVPSGFLPAAARFSGRFDAVVDGVADHVGQRFGKLVDDRLVDFGVFTLGDQADRLAGHVGDFADDARHALEDRLHRLRADRHDAVLDLAGQLLQLLEAHIDRGCAVVVVLDDALRQHRLVDDQLADEVDQAVDTVEIDTDGLSGARGGIVLRGGTGSGSGGGCRGFLLFDASGDGGQLCDVACRFGGGNGGCDIILRLPCFLGGFHSRSIPSPSRTERSNGTGTIGSSSSAACR